MSDELKCTCRNCANCLTTPDYADAACADKPIENADRYGFNGYASIDMANFGDFDCCEEWKPRLDAVMDARAERTCEWVRGTDKGDDGRQWFTGCGEAYLLEELPRYCPSCGAKAKEVER